MLLSQFNSAGEILLRFDPLKILQFKILIAANAMVIFKFKCQLFLKNARNEWEKKKIKETKKETNTENDLSLQ